MLHSSLQLGAPLPWKPFRFLANQILHPPCAAARAPLAPASPGGNMI